MAPTFDRSDRFKKDFGRLSQDEQQRFAAKVRDLFVPALAAHDEFPAGLRVKGVQGAPGVYELTWAPDGRATFQFGEEVIPDEAHIIWRRIGGHEIFGSA